MITHRPCRRCLGARPPTAEAQSKTCSAHAGQHQPGPARGRVDVPHLDDAERSNPREPFAVRGDRATEIDWDRHLVAQPTGIRVQEAEDTMLFASGTELKSRLR